MAPSCGIFDSWTASHFAILILASLSTFGTNYVHDMLNVLQPVFTGRNGCTNVSENVSHCCSDCLDIADRDYNLIHTVLFWTCATSLLISGYLLDKFGNWVIIVLVSFTLTGICIIAVGSELKGTDAVKPLLFIGTFFRGAGHLTCLVARGRLLAGWFLGKEIGCAFGAAAAINRLGSIPSYMLTEILREYKGLPVTLWVGAAVCLFSVLCAVAAIMMDSWATSVKMRELEAERRRSTSLKDVMRFSAEYWVLVALIGFFSGVFRSTQANATEMIHQKFGLRKSLSAIVAGEMLYMSIFLSPLFGLILFTSHPHALHQNKTGRRGYAILVASLLHIPGLSLLGFSDLTPVIGCLFMGVAFCCFTSVLMSSVPLLVDRSCVGMATALAQLSSTICTGAIHVALSAILGRMDNTSHAEKRHRWQLSIGFILGVAVIAAALASILVAMSLKSGSVLTRDPDSETEDKDVDDNGNGDGHDSGKEAAK